MDSKPTKIEERQFDEKQLFLEYFKKTPIISVVCKQIKISRATVYRWFKQDNEFYQKYLETEKEGREYMNEAMESNLINQAKNGNVAATIFYLKFNHPRYAESFGALLPQDITEIAGYIENSKDQQNDYRFLAKLFNKRVPIKVGRYILQIMRRLTFIKKQADDDKKIGLLSKIVGGNY